MEYAHPGAERVSKEYYEAVRRTPRAGRESKTLICVGPGLHIMLDMNF
jgi:hypothetical protein